MARDQYSDQRKRCYIRIVQPIVKKNHCIWDTACWSRGLRGGPLAQLGQTPYRAPMSEREPRGARRRGTTVQRVAASQDL